MLPLHWRSRWPDIYIVSTTIWRTNSHSKLLLPATSTVPDSSHTFDTGHTCVQESQHPMRHNLCVLHTDCISLLLPVSNSQAAVQVVHRARSPVLSELQAPPMAMGLPPPQRAYRRAASAAARPGSNDADETVPLINGGLAAKALRGRQSIAPSRVWPLQFPPAV